ncbi:MAG TPA: EbsC protein, partial [Lachnospiraceae bacterium]|nr:EbsC protein [Lachnospiraceae bacterium]
MSESRVHEYLKAKGYADRITIHDELIDTVEHAAQVIGVSEGQIAKTLSFLVDDRPVLIVMAGDVRV